jgi:hypothetical protein
LNIEKKGSTASGTIGGISIANLSLINAGMQADAMMLDVMTNNPMYFLTNNHLAVTIENTGNVKFEKSITAEDSGNADMKAYIYGRVNTNGSIITNASSDGFTCTRINTGQYRISFTNSPGSANNYIVVATASSSSVNVGVSQINDYFTLYVRDTSSDSYTNAQVSFVVYKK